MIVDVTTPGLRITKRDRRICEHMGCYYASPLDVLLKQFWPGCNRSTGETRLNQLVRQDYLGKDALPMLYYYLRSKGAELLRKVVLPRSGFLQGDFGDDLGPYIVTSIFCSRNNYQLIQQCDAVQRIGKWCEHDDPTQRYFRDGSTAYCLTVNTTMRSKDVIERCLEDGRARRKKHGDKFYERLMSGSYRWCILTTSDTKKQSILDAAKRKGFPAPGAPPEHSLRVVCMPELFQFLPKKKKPKREKQNA